MTTLATQPPTAPAPGLHRHVPFAEYLRWPLLSQSVLKQGQLSMAHLHAAEKRERVKVPTDAMILGTALHVAFLEPEMMSDYVIRWDGGVRRGKEWDAFRDEHASKAILTPAGYESLIGMVRSLRAHPFVRKWVGQIEDTEVSIAGEFGGVPFKARCDALTKEPMVDLKKVRSTDPATVTRTVLAFGYHIQAAIYRTMFNRSRFVLVCVEDEPPFDVCPYELSPALLRIGEAEAASLIQRYRWCQERGEWPGRHNEAEPVMLETPEWMAAGAVTIAGESAFDEE